MPELPELEVIKDELKPLVIEKRIREFKILKPYVLKTYFPGALEGEVIKDVTRRGKYLVFRLTSFNIYTHLMLHGALRFLPPSSRVRKSATALLLLDDGASIEFSEKTTKKRMSVYITPEGKAPASVQNLGIEPLSKEFSVSMLGSLLQSDNRQLKTLLCRQSKIAGIGNAYADEILWKAGLSPFKLSKRLNNSEIRRLHCVIIEVLNWAINEVRCSDHRDKRDFLKIHGKKGFSCPKCGDTVRSVSFAQSDTFYCAHCQTDGRKLKDRRMSKFYR